jgi:hypothetical protein
MSANVGVNMNYALVVAKKWCQITQLLNVKVSEEVTVRAIQVNYLRGKIDDGLRLTTGIVFEGFNNLSSKKWRMTENYKVRLFVFFCCQATNFGLQFSYYET